MNGKCDVRKGYKKVYQTKKMNIIYLNRDIILHRAIIILLLFTILHIIIIDENIDKVIKINIKINMGSQHNLCDT